jgi:hypothetical protein
VRTRRGDERFEQELQRGVLGFRFLRREQRGATRAQAELELPLRRSGRRDVAHFDAREVNVHRRQLRCLRIHLDPFEERPIERAAVDP